jgi:hypothetical protein
MVAMLGREGVEGVEDMMKLSSSDESEVVCIGGVVMGGICGPLIAAFEVGDVGTRERCLLLLLRVP